MAKSRNFEKIKDGCFSGALEALRAFYKAIRPFFGPQTCRFYPTCSEYAFQALKKHGLTAGIFLSVKRLSKCHPFGGGGYDPLP